MTTWEWKSNLAAADSVAAAWTRYSAVDAAVLDRAVNARRETVQLNDKYAVSLKGLFQYAIADPSRRRAVRRAGAKRGAPADSREEPAKKVARGATSGRPDYSQKDPNTTDLMKEAVRRSQMPRPYQSELVFFWYGKHLRKSSTPSRAAVAAEGKLAGKKVCVGPQYRDILACCQRTEDDTYSFVVQSPWFDVGFVKATDFGDWKDFPWIECKDTCASLLNDRGNNNQSVELKTALGPPVRVALRILPKKLTIVVDGTKHEFSISTLADDAVLGIWLYTQGDTMTIVK